MTARGTLERREIVLLRISDADGVTGLGEAVPLSLRGGASLKSVFTEITDWAQAQVDARDGLIPLPASSASRCAVLTALADLEARRAGLPLHELLSPGVKAVPVACNATLTTDSPEGVLAQAEGWAADGFTVFKLKLGSAHDVGQVRAVRDGLGDEVAIRLDANASWSLDQASRILSEVEPLAIELVEQPVENLDEMAALRKRTHIPVVADESVSDSDEAERASRLSACDAITVKLSKIGSLDVRLGGFLPTYLSSALDGPVGIAAAAHAAQSLPRHGVWATVSHGLATERLFSETIADQGKLLDGPLLPVPPGDGLGISIDERALTSLRL